MVRDPVKPTRASHQLRRLVQQCHGSQRLLADGRGQADQLVESQLSGFQGSSSRGRRSISPRRSRSIANRS